MAQEPITVKLDKNDVKAISKKFPGAKEAPIDAKATLAKLEEQKNYNFILNFSDANFRTAFLCFFGFLLQPIIVPIMLLLSYIFKRPMKFMELRYKTKVNKIKELKNQIKVQSKEEYLDEQK